LEQSILIVQKEAASLHGLHIEPPKSESIEHDASRIQSRFNQRCQEAGVNGSLAIVHGEISDQINEYSLLTDLVVLNVSCPPGPGLASLGSGLRTIIWNSASPILAVTEKTSPMKKALLAFDGSAKSKEALFIAAYVAEIWHTELTVMTLSGSDRASSSVQDYARAYLELHEVEAEFLIVDGSFEAFLDVSRERSIDMILMGGYSGNAFKEVVIGSLVNYLLREFEYPILICR